MTKAQREKVQAKYLETMWAKYEKAADDVIAGKYGNGRVRRTKLNAAGYDYDLVQTIVNVKLGG